MKRYAFVGGFAAAVLAFAVPATAATPAAKTCSGTVCVTVTGTSDTGLLARGDSIDIEQDLHITGGAAQAGFAAHYSTGLTADPTSVTVDGKPVTAVVAAGTLTPDLSTVSPLAVGDHEVRYDVTMSTTAVTDQTVYATVTFSDTLGSAPATATSNRATVSLDRPDFQLLSVDEALSSLPAGGAATVSLGTNGPADTPAQLTLSAPAGFSVESVTDASDSTALHCAGAPTTVCTGSFAGLHEYNVEVRAASSDRVGATGTLRVAIEPIGIGDQSPADNQKSTVLTVAGSSALAVTVSPHPKAVYVGRDTAFTITITNDGPDPSLHTAAIVGLLGRSQEFSIHFPSGVTSNGGPLTARWNIGRLDVGKSASVTVEVRALLPGKQAAVGATTITDSFNRLQCTTPSCLFSGSLLIHSAVAPVIVPPKPVAVAVVAQPQLANTGGPVRVPLTLGLLAVFAGGVLLRVGRRRSA